MTDHQRRASPAPSASSLAAALSVAIALTACADGSPTQPSSKAQIAAQLSAAPVYRSAGAVLLDDASTRLLPSLKEVVGRARLRGYLDDLSRALELGDVTDARRQIALARKAISAQLRSSDGADLAAIGLALDQIEEQLSAPSSDPQQ